MLRLGLDQGYLASLECDERIHCAVIESLELEHWHKGRVVLIGDGPKMGEGGCLAIEDATAFAELLQSSKRVEEARLRRAGEGDRRDTAPSGLNRQAPAGIAAPKLS